MATVNKDFRIKAGLVVEGANATVDGEDIITTGSTTDDLAEGTTNKYFTDQRAVDAVSDEIDTAVSTAIDALDTDAIEEGTTNLYFTNQRALDATASAYDASGAAAAAQTAAESYADGLASNYDAAGAASTAETNANTYTDTALEDYTPTSSLDTTVGGYGYLKSADLSSYATESYVGTAIDNLVDGAPGLLDTLNEIAAAINDDENYATTMTTALAGKQDELTAGSNIDITGDTISVTGLDTDDVSEGTNLYFTNQRAIDATSSSYDAAGAAATAEQNAKDYADTNFVLATDLPGQLDDYIPLTQKGAADGVATLDESGKVPASQLDIDVSGDITTAIDELTTDDIEEGALNYYFTTSRAVNAVENADIAPLSVTVGDVSKQVAASEAVATASTVTALAWAKADFRSAKLLVKAETSTHSRVSEVMVTLDASDNVAVTEFGLVYTDEELANVTADVSGTDVRIRVTTINASTDVTVFGTLLV